MVGYCLCLYFGFASLLNISISSGTVITVPDLPEESDEDAPFWRQTVDNSDDVIYEYAEGDEDG